MATVALTNPESRAVPLGDIDPAILDHLFEEQCREWLGLLGWDYSAPSRSIRDVLSDGVHYCRAQWLGASERAALADLPALAHHPSGKGLVTAAQHDVNGIAPAVHAFQAGASPDAVGEFEAAVTALRGAEGEAGRRRALDSLERALKKMRERSG